MKASQRNRIGVLVVAVLIGLWTSPLPAQQLIRTLKGHDSFINSIAFSPDGKTLASGGNDSKIILWDTNTWKEKKTLKGVTSWGRSIAFSPNGKLLASASRGEKIKVWDAITGTRQRTLKRSESDVAVTSFSPDGKTLAVPSNASSTDDPKEIKLLDTRSWKVKLLLKDAQFEDVDTLPFSPDGKVLAVVSCLSPHINLWSTQTGRIVRSLKAHDSSSTSVAFSPDGKLLVAVGTEESLGETTIKVWNVDTGKEHQILKLHSEKYIVSHVLFSPNGKTLVSSVQDGKIRIWDTTTWKEKQTFQHNNRVNCLAFSPDGKTLASGGFILSMKRMDDIIHITYSNYTINIWNMEEK